MNLASSYIAEVRVDIPDVELTPLNPDANTTDSSPINNNNKIGKEEVILLDTSQNNEWIAYVTHRRDDKGCAESICTNLTVRRFSEIKAENNDQQQQPGHQHPSLNITPLIHDAGKKHCKFLSISPNGRYIAISFLEEKLDSKGNTRKVMNPHCLIFEVKDNEIKPNCTKIKFQGRAVFLNKKNETSCALALIDLKSLKVYDNFSSNSKIPTYGFDLRKLASSDDPLQKDVKIVDEYHIENVSWLSTGEEEPDGEMNKLIKYSRHIRHNVLVTPLTNNGVVRVWSMIENGVRLTSFPTSRGEHILAFSKDYKYTATYIKGAQSLDGTDGDKTTLSIYIYNVKSGLLLYKLKSRRSAKQADDFEVSHIKFCYDDRYLALAGVETIREKNESIVVFEIWYIEEEQSIYYKYDEIKTADATYKKIKPFVAEVQTEVENQQNHHEESVIKHQEPEEGNRKIKCLKGFYYTTVESNDLINSYGKTDTKTLILDIDESNDENDTSLEWIKGSDKDSELEKNLDDELVGLKSGHIKMGGETYLIRFGKHTVQLWSMASDGDSKGIISEKDNLLYIRAYKGPSYGLEYSFRETWVIHNLASIKLIKGNLRGRLIVNITEPGDNVKKDGPSSNTYHTEEIFLPLDRPLKTEIAAAVDEEAASPSGSPSGTSTNDVSTTPADGSSTQHSENGESIKSYGESHATSTTQSARTFDDITTSNNNGERDDPHNDTTSSSHKEDNATSRLSYHQFESACQALHYLYTERISKKKDSRQVQQKAKIWKNTGIIYNKTKELANSAATKIDDEYNLFSTIAGSKILAMLASFKDGREVIKIILSKKNPISIFSYSRSLTQRYKKYPAIVDQFSFSGSKKDEDKNDKISQEGEQQQHSLKITHRSSPTKPLPGEYKGKSIVENENVLTVLVEELEYDLYNLLLNRILSDSKQLGPGCLSALTDALLFLQEEGNTELLLSSTEKLSYLRLDREKMGILESEMYKFLDGKNLQENNRQELRRLKSHSTMEQIDKYSGLTGMLLFYYLQNCFDIIENIFEYVTFQNRFFGKRYYSEIRRATTYFWDRNIKTTWQSIFWENEQKPRTNLLTICVVPLPHFNSYANFPEDRPPSSIYEESDENYIIPYKKYSAFTQVASHQDRVNVFRQGNTVLEILLEYKWKKFIGWRFWFVICAVHAVYYIAYSTGVLFSQELYGFVPGKSFLSDHPLHLASILFWSGSGLILFYQEARQLLHSRSPMEYIKSGYNWVDLLTLIFPLITLLQMIYGWDHLNEIKSVATLIVWIHGILRLRIISAFGVTIETIIRLSENIFPALFIMLLVIFAFTNAFMALLGREDDTFFQETYNGTFYNSSVDTPAVYGNTTIQDISSSNSFSDVYKSFSRVWFFIYGVWDPIADGNAGDDKMIMALAIAFSLATSLIFMNIVIALMTNTVEEVRRQGTKIWVTHYADVVSEVELLWCHDDAKHSRKNNPAYIYYIANYNAVKAHEENLQEETERLCKKLSVDSC